MKKAVIAAISLILSAVISVTAMGAGEKFKLDGLDLNNEWYPYIGTYTQLMNSGSSSDNIESAGVRYAFDLPKNCIWYFFSFSCKKSPVDMSKAGIKLRIEDSETIELHLSEADGTKEYDDESYDIQIAMTCINGEISCEVRAVIKDGIGASTSFRAQFYDNDGKLSIAAAKTIENPEYTTTEAEKASETSAAKETASKTTTGKTTAETTVKAKTGSEPAKSTRARTTYSSKLTTRAQKTTVKETSEKTTAVKTAKAEAEKTEKKKPAASEEYQPGYISSQDETTEDGKTTQGMSVTAAETDRVLLTSAYKAAAGIGAAVLFAVVAVWAIKSRNDASDADRKEKESLPESGESSGNKEEIKK